MIRTEMTCYAPQDIKYVRVNNYGTMNDKRLAPVLVIEMNTGSGSGYRENFRYPLTKDQAKQMYKALKKYLDK